MDVWLHLHRMTSLAIALMCCACAGSPVGSELVPPISGQASAGQSALYIDSVDVGGYTLQFACWGQGAPTIIIEDALGVSTLESGGWWAVVSELAATTRVCIYDRAGLGWSDAAAQHPRTSQDMAADLRALVDAAGLPGPYVLVGQSQGAFNALLFASQYPNEVAGLVLVNGAHPHQWTRFQALLPAERPGEPARLSRLRTIHAHPADNSEGWDLIASAHQVQTALFDTANPLGELPLAVLTRSPESAMAPFLPPEIAGPGAQVWQALQAELAALSSHSTHLYADQAGHNIHLHEPERVTAAIRWVLAEAANSGL